MAFGDTLKKDGACACFCVWPCERTCRRYGSCHIRKRLHVAACACVCACICVCGENVRVAAPCNNPAPALLPPCTRHAPVIQPSQLPRNQQIGCNHRSNTSDSCTPCCGCGRGDSDAAATYQGDGALMRCALASNVPQRAMNGGTFLCVVAQMHSNRNCLRANLASLALQASLV